jgi:hypothetical protein
MFGQRAKKEAREHQAAAEDWQAQRDAYAKLLQTAQTFNGTSASELMLAPGEAVFYKVTTSVSSSKAASRRGSVRSPSWSASTTTTARVSAELARIDADRPAGLVAAPAPGPAAQAEWLEIEKLARELAF